MTSDPLIINIDTALDSAFVSLARAGKMLDFISSGEQKEHAVILHTGIKKLLQNQTIDISLVNAVAVTAGPGSYTGLRVGMAAAKGLCYALNIPLITIPTLELLTQNAFKLLPEAYDAYCPMIDARRLEVFTAMYAEDLTILSKPSALVLSPECFNEELERMRIVYFGNGAFKFQALTNHENAIFSSPMMIPETMCTISFDMFTKKTFSDIAFTTPLYIKEFHTIASTSGNL